MPLKLSLKPNERLVINGAVISNGDRRASMVVQNKATILREKDIMQPEEVTTPGRHVYFPIMMMYLDGMQDNYIEEFMRRMTELMDVLENPEIKLLCAKISTSVMAGEFYKGLMDCKKLLKYEAERLSA